MHAVKDLRGKKIAVLRGTSSRYGLVKILQAAGLSPSDVQIMFMSPDAARSAFEAGQIDGWAGWPPFTEEEVAGRGRVLSGGDAMINSVMALPDDLLVQNQPVAEALVRVINQSKAWIRAHPEEAQEVVVSELHLEANVVAAAWGKHDWSARLSPAVLADIQRKSDLLASQGLMRTGSAVRVQDLLDSKYEEK